MSINKLISIKVPVLEALGDMGIDHAKDVPSFTRWAARAEREIGSYFSLKRKVKALVVDKYRAEIPCDATNIQRVLIGDYESQFVDLFNVVLTGVGAYTFKQHDTFLVVDNPGAGKTVQLAAFQWEVQDNHVVLNANYDKQKITIQYLGFDIDTDGFPFVCENHIEAIIEYIMYRYAKRSRFSPTKMDMGDVADLRRQWGILAAEARAVDNEISEGDRNEMLSTLHDPFSGYGMDILYNHSDFGNNGNTFY